MHDADANERCVFCEKTEVARVLDAFVDEDVLLALVCHLQPVDDPVLWPQADRRVRECVTCGREHLVRSKFVKKNEKVSIAP